MTPPKNVYQRDRRSEVRQVTRENSVQNKCLIPQSVKWFLIAKETESEFFTTIHLGARTTTKDAKKTVGRYERDDDDVQ